MSLCCRCEGADGERWHLPVSAMMKCGQKQDSCDSVSFSTDSFSCSLLFPLCRTEYLEVKITKKKNKNIIFFLPAPDLLSQLSERCWCFIMELYSQSNDTVMEQCMR